MKKLISIMLAVMLVLSVSITAFAVEEVDKYEQLKWDVNDYFHSSAYDESDIDEMPYCIYGELSDGTIVMACGGALDGSIELTFGDYKYVCKFWANVYFYKDGEFTLLFTFFNSGELSNEVMDELCQISVESINNPHQKHFPKFEFYRISDNGAEEAEALYGDVDGDGVITITDATMIQKMGIGMLEVNPFGDVNGDGRVSIMDVTLVQKYIAELGYNTGNVGQPATI